MLLRKLRWLALAAVIAAPSRSDAGVDVLVQEVDSGGNVVQTVGTFSTTGTMLNAGTGGRNNSAGVNQVSATTTVEGVTSAASVDSRGDGSVVFPPADTTTGNVPDLPNPYSIIQTILIKALPVNGSAQISVGATF